MKWVTDPRVRLVLAGLLVVFVILGSALVVGEVVSP